MSGTGQAGWAGEDGTTAFERREREPDDRVVAFEDADAVFDALASGTARAVLRRLHRSPAPASVVAEAVDTSVQNAAYHLDRLVDAGLAVRVGTRYSAKGREMAVYAATPVIVRCGGDGTDATGAD
jgi:DNA-binding transcriptional ArsR family regulator